MRLRRDFGFRSVSAELPRATCSKITFECSILYRLLLLMGAPFLRFLRSSRCRKATGLSIQLTYRDPSGRPCARSETCRTKGNTMQMPSMLEGESLKRLLQGAAAGAVATIFVGFYWGGWSLGSTADKMAKERPELAVIAVLAPVCADKFRALPDAEAKQVALSKVDSWKRRDEFPKEFVTLPGESYPSSALVDACYTLLLAPKSAALK